MHSKIEYHLELPDDFDEYFWGSKGYFPNAKLTIDRKTFIVTFYEPIRFQQDIVEEIKSDSFFFQNNIIIVKHIDQKCFEHAIEQMIKLEKIEFLQECK